MVRSKEKFFQLTALTSWKMYLAEPKTEKSLRKGLIIMETFQRQTTTQDTWIPIS